MIARPGIERAGEPVYDFSELSWAQSGIVIDAAMKKRYDFSRSRPALYELVSNAEAEELEIRAVLLAGLERWLAQSDMSRRKTAKLLGIAQAGVLDIERGRVDRFTLDLLVRLAVRAGLHPKMKLAT